QRFELDDAPFALPRYARARWRPGVRFLDEGIPFAARRALACPARRSRPAGLADVKGARGFRHFSPTAQTVIAGGASKIVSPGEPSCETRDPTITFRAAALGPGSALRSGRDDNVSALIHHRTSSSR